ncbi:monooxygenase [Coniophora puteana RWD-64-598 SS2]|uniref:Monooxygenase n=1 Tax=Coniophora puteana (strain RWD-64-598) TaxID=741705 RepID=A0A5M3MGN9_CONPW|nr:monooxygenase [Coniophora puteana RWD-64-598 SS2]EIW77934.1 monooxygenase [Coniophora puteana RWD-64-598 SS2]
MSQAPLPVLIVGAGPTGIVAALSLLRNGIPVRIIEKDPHSRLGQRGPGLMPRTLEIFDYLNVPEVYQTSSEFPNIKNYDQGSTEVKATYSMLPDYPKTPGTPHNQGRMLGQQTLERLLRKHIDAYGVQTELGVELRTIEQDENRVRAHVVRRDGDNEVEDVIEAAYLIGADGAKGAVRKQLGLTFFGETYDNIRLLISDVRVTSSFLGREYMQTFGNFKDGAIGFRPTKEIAEDGYQLTISGDNHDLPTLAKGKVALEALIKKCVPGDVKLEEVLWCTEWRANVRMADTFSKGRCFVAGDAAHVHTPAGGQGLNSGMQDSFNLAWKLALAYKGLASSSLLESYSAERLPVIADMLNMTTKLMERQRTISVPSKAFQRGPHMFMLSVNYRPSGIVLEEVKTGIEPIDTYGSIRDGNIVAGDRAPDAPGVEVLGQAGEDKTRLMQVFTPTAHTVLVFAPDANAALPVLEGLTAFDASIVKSAVVLAPGAATHPDVGANAIVVDNEGHAYSEYQVEKGETRVVVVRPDGVIGATVKDAGGVKRYFEKIFGQ